MEIEHLYPFLTIFFNSFVDFLFFAITIKKQILSEEIFFCTRYLTALFLRFIRGENLELGRDADTGGQTKYVPELTKALS